MCGATSATGPTWDRTFDAGVRMSADHDLVALGGDLEPPTLLEAYRLGMFPMPVRTTGGPVLGWWSPDPRGVLPLDGLRVSRSLRRSLRRFTVTADTAFADVVAACAAPARSGG